MKGDNGSKNDRISDGVIEWMQTHTIADLKTMVSDFERRGENASELRGFIHELVRIVKETENGFEGETLHEEQVPA